MHPSSEKASVLIEALPYIQRFRGEIVVVKFGGSLLNDWPLCLKILKDIAFMECVGLRPVVVHGGGKAISTAMEQAGLKPKFVDGLRVTDQATIDIVERVLREEVNPKVVEAIRSFGCAAKGLHGTDLLQVEKVVKGKQDWGFVGQVVDAETKPIRRLVDRETVPVMTPLGRDAKGQPYNVNADEAAGAIACHLQARKLVFLSDVPGLLRDPADRSSVISSLQTSQVDDLIEAGVIAGGMLPKMLGAVKAIESGIRKVHFIDAGMPHSLLLELFTAKGVGTEIVA